MNIVILESISCVILSMSDEECEFFRKDFTLFPKSLISLPSDKALRVFN